jgi:putative spermidine/putrescine transport system ATP-binding protein
MSAPLSPSAAIAGEAEELVAFHGVSKSYDGRTLAVEKIDFAISRGEFLTLLGPSGSGKTTTLMMLAGFENPSSGDIMLNGESLSSKPPHRRNMGVVFQNYALFPHMTVADNLAFPLGVRGIRGARAKLRVEQALDLVRLSGLDNRRPAQLSGGQQQRIALARALIFQPDIVLMDEPLGALDRQLREHMQDEIRRIHRQLGITIVYVTHDQSEALALSDRIAIFADGTIQQIDSPQAIYRRPANAFVAGFVGENNAISGTIASSDTRSCKVTVAGGRVIEAVPVGRLESGQRAIVTVRPDRIGPISQEPYPANRFDAEIEHIAFHGDHSRICARLRGGDEIRMVCTEPPVSSGAITIGWPAEDCFAFPAPEPH